MGHASLNVHTRHQRKFGEEPVRHGLYPCALRGVSLVRHAGLNFLHYSAVHIKNKWKGSAACMARGEIPREFISKTSSELITSET